MRMAILIAFTITCSVVISGLLTHTKASASDSGTYEMKSLMTEAGPHIFKINKDTGETWILGAAVGHPLEWARIHHSKLNP